MFGPWAVNTNRHMCTDTGVCISTETRQSSEEVSQPRKTSSVKLGVQLGH